MVFYTVGDLDRQIGLYSERLGIDFDGKKRSECIEVIQDSCPQLHPTPLSRHLRCFHPSDNGFLA